MASVDSTANINRIIQILSNDTPLAAIIRTFQFGEDNHDIHDGNFPYLLVTTPNRPITSRDTFGIGDGNSDPQTTVQYLIKGFVLEKNSEKSETQKYDILKLVIDIIRSNPRLKDPVLLNDPKCIRSTILSVDDSPDSRGKENQGFVIVLQCQIGSEFPLDIAGFTAIPLISKPIERETEITENVYNTARIRKGVSPITEIHSFLAEMEYIEAQVSAFRTQKRNRAVISTTLNRPGSSTTYSGKLVEVSNGASYDQLETVTILFEVIH